MNEYILFVFVLIGAGLYCSSERKWTRYAFEPFVECWWDEVNFSNEIIFVRKMHKTQSKVSNSIFPLFWTHLIQNQMRKTHNIKPGSEFHKVIFFSLLRRLQVQAFSIYSINETLHYVPDFFFEWITFFYLVISWWLITATFFFLYSSFLSIVWRMTSHCSHYIDKMGSIDFVMCFNVNRMKSNTKTDAIKWMRSPNCDMKTIL